MLTSYVTGWIVPVTLIVDQVAVNGTDGLQFSLKLSTDDTLYTFSPDLCRNLYFTYQSTNDSYSDLETYMYYLNDTVLQNITANDNYNIKINGTSDLTTILRAPAIATKGHYYGLQDSAISSTPEIVDSSGVPIAPSQADDDTYLGVEQFTGVSLINMERLFFNLILYKDELFADFAYEKPSDNGYFFPLAYRSREMQWSDDQVDDTFGSMIKL